RDRGDVRGTDQGSARCGMAHRRGDDPRRSGLRGMGLRCGNVAGRVWYRHLPRRRWTHHPADGEFQDHRGRMSKRPRTFGDDPGCHPGPAGSRHDRAGTTMRMARPLRGPARSRAAGGEATRSGKGSTLCAAPLSRLRTVLLMCALPVCLAVPDSATAALPEPPARQAALPDAVVVPHAPATRHEASAAPSDVSPCGMVSRTDLPPAGRTDTRAEVSRITGDDREGAVDATPESRQRTTWLRCTGFRSPQRGAFPLWAR